MSNSPTLIPDFRGRDTIFHGFPCRDTNDVLQLAKVLIRIQTMRQCTTENSEPSTIVLEKQLPMIWRLKLQNKSYNNADNDK